MYGDCKVYGKKTLLQKVWNICSKRRNNYFTLGVPIKDDWNGEY